MLKSFFAAVNAIVSFGSFWKPDQNHPSARLCWYVPSDLDLNNSFKQNSQVWSSWTSWRWTTTCSPLWARATSTACPTSPPSSSTTTRSPRSTWPPSRGWKVGREHERDPCWYSLFRRPATAVNYAQQIELLPLNGTEASFPLTGTYHCCNQQLTIAETDNM